MNKSLQSGTIQNRKKIGKGVRQSEIDKVVFSHKRKATDNNLNQSFFLNVEQKRTNKTGHFFYDYIFIMFKYMQNPNYNV